MYRITVMPIRWKLKTILAARDIRVKELADEIEKLGGKTRSITLYRITGRGSQITPKGFDVLEDVIAGLNSITKNEYTPNDLIEVVKDA
jgi:DNA-binding Xre family transcriptional regulator